MFLRVILPLLAALSLSGCDALFESFAGSGGSSPGLIPGTVATVQGEVVGTVDDCAFDGICALVLATDAGTVDAIWAEGMMRCEGTLADNLGVGDTVTATGIVREPDALSICPDPSYSIQRVSP